MDTDFPPEQPRLDLDLDDPVPYVLTARARRTVAPGSLPPLAVVPDDQDAARTGELGDRGEAADAAAGESDEPEGRDTRRSRARALARAGVPPPDIAAEVEAPLDAVLAWIDGVVPTRAARRRLRAVQVVEMPAQPKDPDLAFASARDLAARAAAVRLSSDARFAAGVGLVSGRARLDRRGAVLTLDDAQTAAALLTWLRSVLPLADDRIRLLLRLAPQLAADRVVDRWAETLRIEASRLRHTRWSGAPTATSVELDVTLTSAEIAGTLAGWRDALRDVLGAPDLSATGG